MNGYQLTFYTERNRKCGHLTFCEWLLQEVRKRDIRGATVISAAEGIGHAGAHHAAHILKLADQPVQVILAVTEHEADEILEVVRAANVHVFYTRAPIEFGLLGEDAPPKKAKTFFRFHRPTGTQSK
ncbi:PII-like signaling protein [Caballeronia udeis]|jgi:PII-like signaling protein|uniref:PII-like signaling protein n=1 Tax=Caballeronia udeis TaxID=1232866 RepID=A0ABW8MRN0_9BURK